MKRILVIAGTDSSGGAGLTRDSAVARDFGCIVLPVVTAVTAQSDGAVQSIQPMSCAMVSQQIQSALDGGQVDAVKVGMLGTGDIAERVAAILDDIAAPVVIDPVLMSTSGTALIDNGLPARLVACADVLTPNLPEAAVLTGCAPVMTFENISAQAQSLLNLGAGAVLIKGGHADDATCTDHLFQKSGHQPFTGLRLSVQKRGTGCTLATAIACELAAGKTIAEACKRAKAYVADWLEGQGPPPFTRE